jgi:hypothetical protein
MISIQIPFSTEQVPVMFELDAIHGLG